VVEQVKEEEVKKKKFQMNEFKIIKHLGAGSFGQVKLVLHNKSRQYFALKCLTKENIRGKKQIQHILNERDILAKFKKADFCCNIHESLQDTQHLYMVLDFLPGGELFKLIRKQVFMSEENARFYLAEIILAIDTLHSMGIIYRDLKPENILLD
jgi:serine/threonine protein kinase|tara:strand:+ start:2468 stop:2929 length:462 start_codon:yes stop_codon:yes gene_type:complete